MTSVPAPAPNNCLNEKKLKYNYIADPAKSNQQKKLFNRCEIFDKLFAFYGSSGIVSG